MGSEHTTDIKDSRLPKGAVLKFTRGIGKKIKRGPMFYKDHPSEKIGWRTEGYLKSDVVIEIVCRGHVIAGLAYDFRGSKNGAVIESHGTYVARRRRGQGLGTVLWDTAIKQEAAVRVEMQVISDLGMTLVNSLEKKFPEIGWAVSEGGRRDLRKLKKKTARRRT